MMKHKIVPMDEMERKHASDFLSIYANNTGLAANFYDISLIFGAFRLGDDGAAFLEDRLAVTVSWEHAKALVAALQKSILEYETENKSVVRTMGNVDGTK